jgi:hypothetical protein
MARDEPLQRPRLRLDREAPGTELQSSGGRRRSRQWKANKALTRQDAFLMAPMGVKQD